MTIAGTSSAPAVPNPTPTWKTGVMVERQALLFDDGEILLADRDAPGSLLKARADFPGGHLGRVRVIVLEVEPLPGPVDALPQGALEILRQVRDTPAIGAKVRAEIDRLLAGAAT